MTNLREAWARAAAFFRKRELDGDFEEELAAHLDLATEDFIRQGLSPAEARRKAVIRLGGIQPLKELHRDSRGLPWLDGVAQDFRFALRSFRRTPAFTLVAVAMLALGIGVNVIVYTVADAVLFKGFRLVHRNDRLVYIDSPKNGTGCCLSYQDFEDWKSQAKSFSGMGAARGVGVILADPSGFPETDDATQVTVNTFQVIGQKPFLGRDFAPSDEAPDASPVAILNYDFWNRRFARDPAVVGRAIHINGVATEIIGVMPRGFSFPQRQDLWMPLTAAAEAGGRQARDLWVAVARLAPGATIQTARTEMESIGERLAAAYPSTNRDRLPMVRNFDQFFIGPDAGRIYGSMFAAVGFVVLIACANLANLMLARSIGRSREISIRIALGAGRWRVMRQLLIESVMLSAAAGAAGWWIAKWGVAAYQFAEWPPGTRPWRILDYSMDESVVVYLIALSIGTGLLFGLAPARRLSKLDVNGMLKDGGHGASGGGHGRYLSFILVAAEMALAVLLLTGAGIMMRSFLNIYRAGVGVPTANILTASMALPESKYPTAESRIAFYGRLEAGLESIPGVESVAIANRLPAGGSLTLPAELDDSPAAHHATLSAIIAGPGYFRTLGAKVIAGREFAGVDEAYATPVAIVNRRFASRYWPGQDALGKRLRFLGRSGPEAWLTVIGVVSNIVQDYARQSVDPLVYLPYGQAPAASMNVIARTSVPPATIGTAFRRQVQGLDSNLPIFGPSRLADRLVWSYWNSGFYGVLFLIFAGLALLLASIGLYAVMAHSVLQRRQEIGIRLAIGATATDILRLVFKQGMPPLGAGLILGLAASVPVNRVLKSVLVHVSPVDPLAYLIATAMLILFAALSCSIPARRAMSVDPVVALKHE